jgi:hypothetical protein
MVSIREATSGDGPAILAVHRAAIRGIEPGTYAPAAIDAWVATQDDPSQYPLDDPTQYVAVATIDGDSVDATAREDRAVVTAREDSAVVGFVGLDLDRGVLETVSARRSSNTPRGSHGDTTMIAWSPPRR